MAREIRYYLVSIGDFETGKFVCEIKFDFMNSEELRILADFCRKRYYVISIHQIIEPEE